MATTSSQARAGSCASTWAATLDDELDHWVYVGDSTNDARMFGHFPHSVGVANVARFCDRSSRTGRAT